MSFDDLNSRFDEIEGLVALVQEGDSDAFAKLYDILINPIYRYVYFKVNSNDAEDLVETVFLKVWENIRQYSPKKKSFTAWVFKIAHNLVVDYYRGLSDKAVGELPFDVPDQTREHNPIRTTQRSLDKEILKIALSKISSKYRDIIVYKFINELSNQEIAEILGKSEGSLRILQFRALKALKAVLNELGITYL